MLQRSPPSVEKRRKQRREATWRYRQRVRKGPRVAYAPYDSKTLGFLVDTGWIDPALTFDPDAIGKAIFAMMKDAARAK